MNRAVFVWTPWAIGSGFAVATIASFVFLGVDFIALLSGESARQMAVFAAGFFPPDLSVDFLRRVARGAAETLAISTVGTLFAMAIGAALALPAARRWGPALKPPTRIVLNLLRAIPELVWAVFMVLAAGLGPFAGALALALHTAGVLGRLFAETLENAPREPAQALRDAGSGATIAFLYGTLPVVAPQWLSYVLYRWEYNIRMAAVLGFVGAGGLGQMLYVSLSVFMTHEASTLILAMIAIVTAVDVLSAWTRRFLGRSGA